MLIIDLRQRPNGGELAEHPKAIDTTQPAGSRVEAPEFRQRVAGRHVVLVTHGFKVPAMKGETALERFEPLCQLDADHLFIAVLWPGDAKHTFGLDYPVEVPLASCAGNKLASFLATNASGARSLSFVSHSLGARVILQAVHVLPLEIKVRTLVLMASAIDDDALRLEYRQAAERADEVHVVSSDRDLVLRAAFPIGNLAGRFILSHHPYWRRALGLHGPDEVGEGVRCQSWPALSSWRVGHGDYLPSEDGAPRPLPELLPLAGAPAPSPPSAWTAAIVGTANR